jgi:GNAT superfamily N-acetyltransferase
MMAALRRALPHDAEAIASIHIRGWQSAYRGQLPDSYLDRLGSELDRRAEFWRTHLAHPPSDRHQVWVAELDAVARGFAALGPARDSDANAGELYAIYVDPDFWGQGLGRLLLTRAAASLTAMKFSTAMLWVLESNARTRQFYEHAGWATDGGRKLETTADGVELREVSYRISLITNEAS